MSRHPAREEESMSDASWPDSFEDILRSCLPVLPDGKPLAADMTLTELGLDSLGMVTLMLELEETFGISFPDESLTPETFATGRSLWSVAAGLMAGSPDHETAGE
jgi:acyl carrier protein